MEITGSINYVSMTPEIPLPSFPLSFPFPFQDLGLLMSVPSPVQTTSPPLCLSSNYTSDESEEQQRTKTIIDERRQRRMISNRESARRSRMRKQRHLDELWSQVIRLRNENNRLIDKLNHVSESHQKVVQENARLKEEASELKQMISSMQLANAFRDLDVEIHSDHHDHYIRTECSSNQQSGCSASAKLKAFA
ncbi:hypothetical protein Cgig2_007850 [Carnegiea gigantea]|uniref:BZIP domain-containing protein n=1 Tax=Carnegiea gigantea TaxID=171969 RepID=A0A9Q1GX98_9CARY|nr:hypothetical protein Cgig2_007850 [Carnegiea gigantea]